MIVRALTRGNEDEFDDVFGGDAPEVRRRSLQWLESAPVLERSDRPDEQPIIWYCDGRYLWSEHGRVAVEERGLAVPVEFAKWVLEQKEPPEVLTDKQREQGLEALREM